MMASGALTPIVLITTLLVFALAVAQLRKRLPRDDASLPAQIDSLLPQTQCAQCGYPGCQPYAEAVANGAAIDLCPPGGPELITHLRDLMGANAPLSKSATPTPATLIAVIDESECIGCALCLPPCPVDAIVGAQGYMHTVLAEECTGCELCVPACPVDCISLVTLPEAPTPKPAKVSPASRGCINCGKCITACPRDLDPDQLFKLSQGHAWDAAADLGLQACIECGLCDRVCPSEINLAEIFTHAKRIDTHQRQDRAHKAAIKLRYEAHGNRLAEREESAQHRRMQRLQRRRNQAARSDQSQVGP